MVLTEPGLEGVDGHKFRWDTPDAVGWSKLVDGLAKITVRCNACHAVFRVK